MRFDSLIFPLFLAVVLAAYWGVARAQFGTRIQNWLILVSSYVFYGWWDPRFLALIALSTVVDFLVASRIDASTDPIVRRRLVQLSVGVNLGVLGLFKYFNFFVGSAIESLETLGVAVNAPLLAIVLPVGISFYTFQTLGYTVDVYRGRQRAERDLLAFGCYVAFFPQLVAGPIERASRLLPQFHVARTLDPGRFRSGATLIVYGLVKKVAVADNVAPMVDYVYALEPGAASAPLILAGTVAFAIQIYADFSGYSDIARGVARLMGFELCVNFDKPYVSATPSEFWRRWHISLSQWLRDYLYVEAGGNRGTALLTYRNLMLTMVLGGLWHGAAWNFVAWGAFHGAILCAYRLARADERLARAGVLGRPVAVVVFAALTLYGWLLFRASSWSQVVGFTAGLVSGWGDWALAAPILMTCAYFVAPVVAHHILSRGLGGEKWAPHNAWLWRVVVAAVILYGITHARASETAFIYFQF